MKIENIDALKSWIVRRSLLIQKADVDAGALSRYVVALLKKNNSSEELKEMCVDHIDCFFVEKTRQFVDILFISLNSKSYLTDSDDKVEIELMPDSNASIVTEPDVKSTNVDCSSKRNLKHKPKEDPTRSRDPAGQGNDVGKAEMLVSSSQSGRTTPVPRKKMKEVEQHEDVLLQTGLDSHQEDNYSDIVFGRYIGAQLGELPNSYAKEMLKLEIQQLLAKAQFPKLQTE